jgi:RND superfamily putative drug exporter
VELFPLSQYLYRFARFAFRRRRLVLAVWLVAVIAAIALAVGSGGKTNDTLTIPGAEAQNATSVLTAKLPAYSGGQTTIVFAAANGAKLTSPADEAAIN